MERTGSAAKPGYQRKRCLTTAVKTFSSLSPALFRSLPSFFFWRFPVVAFGAAVFGRGEQPLEFGKAVNSTPWDVFVAGL